MRDEMRSGKGAPTRRVTGPIKRLPWARVLKQRSHRDANNNDADIELRSVIPPSRLRAVRVVDRGVAFQAYASPCSCPTWSAGETSKRPVALATGIPKGHCSHMHPSSKRLRVRLRRRTRTACGSADARLGAHGVSNTAFPCDFSSLRP
jgi:hypothetical protein